MKIHLLKNGRLACGRKYSINMKGTFNKEDVTCLVCKGEGQKDAISARRHYVLERNKNGFANAKKRIYGKERR